jgi:hypothetical protein
MVGVDQNRPKPVSPWRLMSRRGRMLYIVVGVVCVVIAAYGVATGNRAVIFASSMFMVVLWASVTVWSFRARRQRATA